MTVEQREKVRQMRAKGAGYAQIASFLGISKNTVKSFCRRNQVQTNAENTGATSVEGLACKRCGKRLIQKSKQKPKKFCSDQCRLAWWRDNDAQLNKKALYAIRCASCGQEFESYGNRRRKYCGHACYIKDRFERAG